MSVQLRNKSGDRFVPDLNRSVKSGEVVEVPGSVKAELADCVVTTGPLGDRAWPSEMWSLVRSTKDKPTKGDSSPAKTESSEE